MKNSIIISLLFALISCDVPGFDVGIIREKGSSSVHATPSRVNGGMITNDGEQRKCRIIAHRGYWKAKGAYENSIASIDAAAELGVDGIEFDLWKTKDDSIIVNHNTTYDGKYIPGSLYSDLIQIPLPNGERLPTLREYLRRIKSYPHLILFVEFKSAQAVEPTLTMLNKEKIENPCVFISFTQGASMKVLKLQPEAHVELLQSTGEPVQTDSLLHLGYSGLAYHLSFYRKFPKVIDEAQRFGMTLSTWTVNTVPDYDYFYENGFSYAITDSPDLLVKQTLEDRNYWSKE